MANAIQVGGGVATIGPQDPDNTAGLTERVGVHNKADTLLKNHQKNWPKALRTALALPRDVDRSAALDTDEVHEALLAVPKRQRFFREEYKLLDAVVRGLTRGARCVSVLYEVPSGRVAHGVIPYKGLTKSQRAYDAKVAKDAGEVQALPPVIQTDPQVEAQIAAEKKRADDAIDAQAKLQRQLDEQAAQIAKLQRPEPFEGYDDLNASEVVAKIKAGGWQEYGLAGLEAIQEHEATRPDADGGPRKTILDAVKKAAEDAPPPPPPGDGDAGSQ